LLVDFSVLSAANIEPTVPAGCITAADPRRCSAPRPLRATQPSASAAFYEIAADPLVRLTLCR
jgi:hypothetical protein